MYPLRCDPSSSGSIGDDRCDSVAKSADGQRAAHASLATNPVPGDTNDTNDVFVTAIAPATDDVFASGFGK